MNRALRLAPDPTPPRWRRVTMRDDTLPHQIRLEAAAADKIAVGCVCGSEPIEIRALWEPGEAIAVWRDHLTAVTG